MDAEGVAFSMLVGRELGSVVFVRDYLELDFDGPQLSFYAWPRLVLAAEELCWGDPGYRDGLCDLIGRRVTGTVESSAAGLMVDFDDHRLVIHPQIAELDGPEVAKLVIPPDGRDWVVWRAGEPPFGGPEWS
jgi:hypothetical protein